MTTVFIALMTCLIAPDTGAEIHTTEGDILHGKPVECLEGGSLVLQTKGGTEVLAVEDMYAVYFDGGGDGVSTVHGAGISFVDGSFLSGEVTGGNGEKLFFRSEQIGDMEISINALAKLVFANPSVPRDFDRCQGMSGDDVLYRRHEGARGRDYIQGTLVEFNDSGLSFDCSLGLIKFSLSDLEALALFQVAGPEPLSGTVVEVLLHGGSGMLRGSLRGIDSDSVSITTVFDSRVVIEHEEISCILFRGGRIEHVSEIEPCSKEELPYIGDAEYFLYPFKKDRSVTGCMLSSGGRKFVRGIGLHSRSALTYQLNGEYTAFESFVGICDEVLSIPAEGSVVFEVLVDSKSAFKSSIIRSGAPPVKTPRIDLKGALTITLVADFADGFDSGDRALFGHPVLVRK